MAEIATVLVLPDGSTRPADMPDDVTMRELLDELVPMLSLPTVGPDGRPMGYRVDSKALGRKLEEHETLATAAVPASDRLILTTDITAGVWL